MPISANTLFHVTPNFKNLKSILREGFRVHYCYETFTVNWTSIKQKTTLNTDTGIWIPVVSFSDIPLSQISEHFKKYKSTYAIGMSKEWAINNKLNPVTYIQENSLLAQNFIEFMNKNFSEYSHNLGNNDTDKSYRMFRYFLSYTKNYKGVYKKNGIDYNNLAYNEREWRFVPTDDDLVKIGITKDLLNEDDFLILNNGHETKKYLKEIIQEIKLTFSPNDVKYIIVKKKKDIQELMEFIFNEFTEDADELIAKTFTLKQILNDF